MSLYEKVLEQALLKLAADISEQKLRYLEDLMATGGDKADKVYKAYYKALTRMTGLKENASRAAATAAKYSRDPKLRSAVADINTLLAMGKYRSPKDLKDLLEYKKLFPEVFKDVVSERQKFLKLRQNEKILEKALAALTKRKY